MPDPRLGPKEHAAAAAELVLPVAVGIAIGDSIQKYLFNWQTSMGFGGASTAEDQEKVKTLRIVYGGALINGPFSVLVARRDCMIGFNDRIKLRPMVAARKDEVLYVASEEAAVRVMCRKPDTLWHAEGGVPIVGRLNAPADSAVA